MKIGIIGAGSIAEKMAETLQSIPEVSCYAIAARDEKRAIAFAQKYGFEKAYGSYEAMVQDEAVELVYIATPHSHHYDHVKLCIDHMKHVLCEKPMTINKKQAVELFEKAKEKKVLLTEAMWTRYMPSRQLIDDVIESGILGKITTLNANIGYPIAHKERMMEPALAGGALLDIGIYPINFALMTFGHEIENISATAVLSEKGVDLQNSMTFTYKDGKMAVLQSTALSAINRAGIISGDKGYMVVDNINNCEGICVYNTEHELLQRIEVPKQVTGFEYEVRATVKAIQEGKRECQEMPHQETLKVLEIMDTIRKQWNLYYPQEQF